MRSIIGFFLVLGLGTSAIAGPCASWKKPTSAELSGFSVEILRIEAQNANLAKQLYVLGEGECLNQALFANIYAAELDAKLRLQVIDEQMAATRRRIKTLEQKSR
jgi:hypothetical protein